MSIILNDQLIAGGGSGGGGASRNIGEIVASSIPLTDAGLHLLDGSLINGSGSYSGFVNYIAGLRTDYPDLFETEANWQTAITTYGVCGKFVYDSVNNTVRLPKIEGFIEGTNIVSNIGSLVQAGLPDITGSVVNSSSDEELLTSADKVTATGAFTIGTKVNKTYGTTATADTGYDAFYFNASNSNSIYGNSDTVQPQAIKVLYYIVVATSTKTDIEVDIDEIATDLNGKADVDLTNINSSCKALDGQWVESSSILASNISAPTSTDLEYSLASYLPNDGYNYEVLFTGQATSGASSGNVCNIHLKTDIIADYVLFARAITKTTSNNSTYGTCILPVGTNRKATVVAYSANTGAFYLYARGYRRIGTNV